MFATGFTRSHQGPTPREAHRWRAPAARAVLIASLLYSFLGSAGADKPELRAEDTTAPEGVGVRQALGTRLPGSAILRSEQGEDRPLESWLGKPIILVPGYYECPRLCGLVYSATRDAVQNGREYGLEPGRDYRILSLSFNAAETAEAARSRAALYRQSLRLDANAWPFLRARAEVIQALLEQAGYRFRPDGRDFSHPATLIVLTADGRISRYLDGFDVSSRDFRFALIEASGGRIGNPVDRVFQLCFRWDNAQGRYAPVAWAFIRIGGAITLFTLIGLILFLRRSERKT